VPDGLKSTDGLRLADAGARGRYCPQEARHVQQRPLSPRLTVEDYLVGEQASQIRHEYVDGAVFAMGGASDRHNLLAGNLHTALNNRLPEHCQVFMSDMKVRVRTAEQEAFYYPDVLVSCDPSDRQRYFRERPVLVAEVLSPSTERVDLFEKLFLYQRIDCLQEYLVIAQDFREVRILRRTARWNPLLVTEGELRLEAVGLTLTVDELYRRTGL
jgi:Uma2 family endonuclease